MPISLHDRDPELIARLDGSLERARKVAMLSPDGASKIGGAGLEAAAAKEAAEFRKKDPGKYSFEAIVNDETRLEFQNALRGAEAFFALGDIDIPTESDLSNSGVDISWLAHCFDDLLDNGIVPSIVLAPYGLGASKWTELFDKLPRQERFAPGLMIDYRLAKDWNTMDKTFATKDHRGSIIQDENGREWSMGVVTALPEPDVNNVNYYGHRNAMEFRSRPITPDDHPTISEYLTLQALNIINGLRPVDEHKGLNPPQTWLYGNWNFNTVDLEMMKAPRGYSTGAGNIALTYEDPHTSFDAGIREVYR